MRKFVLRLGVYSAAFYLVFIGGAGAQAANYELFDNGSSLGQNGINTFNSIRLDHVNNKYFVCSVTEDNAKQTVSGQCSASITDMPPGTNIKTIIVGGTKADQVGSLVTLWEIDQTSGATYFCNGAKQDTKTAWCTTLTINP
jgi:hypothetical protein